MTTTLSYHFVTLVKYINNINSNNYYYDHDVDHDRD